MTWSKAILRVLSDSKEPMHYKDIAQAIVDNGYRTNVGATPANTVAAVLSQNLRDKVERRDAGFYSLRESKDGVSNANASRAHRPVEESVVADPAVEDSEEMGLINAFGMFWSRSEVDWSTRIPPILGVQQSGSDKVDFAEQAGVYLLYDGNRVIYVGRVIEARLATRLWEHTRDRLTGRWDRFSWFGVRGVLEDGALSPIPSAGIEVRTLIATMEALLIEGLEPPQNRRQGDGFSAVEFLQAPDPKVTDRRNRAIINELLDADRRA